MAENHVVNSPFDEELVTEIDLPAAPVLAAILQVRFPGQVSALRSALMDGRVTSALEDEYPFLEKNQELGISVQLGHQPLPFSTENTNWTMRSEDSKWTVNITNEFIALTSRSYTSRSDFMQRASSLISAVQTRLKAPNASRIGVRYVNQVHGPELFNWIQALQPGAAGIFGQLDEESAERVSVALSEVRHQWNPQTGIQARWGVIPPNAVIEATAPAIPTTSWILDIDTFYEDSIPFDSTAICDQAMALSARAYRFFRWVVPQPALKRFGAE